MKMLDVFARGSVHTVSRYGNKLYKKKNRKPYPGTSAVCNLGENQLATSGRLYRYVMYPQW
jgi:hypothetical protein